MEPEQLLGLYNKLLAELTSGGGLQGLTRQLSAHVAMPVIITDGVYRILACSSAVPGLVEGNLLFLSSIDPESGRCIISTEANSWKSLIFPISCQDNRLGYLFILEPGVDSTQELIPAGKQAALLAALEFAKLNCLQAVQRQYKEDFISDLLYSNLDSAETIISRGEIWGWNLNRPHSVIVFQLDGYEHFSPDRTLMEELFELVETAVVEIDNKPIIMQKRGEVIVILPLEGANLGEHKSRVKALVDNVQRRVAKKIVSRLVRVGAGRVYSSPTEIFRSYQEAKVALELGQLMEMKAETPFFSDMGMARILYNHDRQELQEFYQETLGKLEEQDRQQGILLVDTLEKYLANNCDLKAAGKELFVHPNTLRYRLKKLRKYWR